MGDVRREIIPALVALLLLGIVRYGLQRLGFATWSSELISAALLLILLILLLRFYRPVRRRFVLWGAEAELKQDGFDQQAEELKATLARLIAAPNGSELSQASGLMGWYPNFDACRPRLESLLTEATSVRLLTYMGISDIGKGTVFYEAISRNDALKLPVQDDSLPPDDSKARVRVLLCSRESPYVSPQFAAKIGHEEEKAEHWRKRIDMTEESIKNLKRSHHVEIERRSHNLPFVWRLWFVDDVLFVTAMLYARGRENIKVPVYEIHRSADPKQQRLFEMFERYFDREWDRANEPQ